MIVFTNRIKHCISKVAKRDGLIQKIWKIFANDIVNIALYNIALIGGDFQTHHSENGISRTFVTEKKCYKFNECKGVVIWQ